MDCFNEFNEIRSFTLIFNRNWFKLYIIYTRKDMRYTPVTTIILLISFHCIYCHYCSSRLINNLFLQKKSSIKQFIRSLGQLTLNTTKIKFVFLFHFALTISSKTPLENSKRLKHNFWQYVQPMRRANGFLYWCWLHLNV